MNTMKRNVLKLDFYVSVLLSVLTLLTFALAMIAVPPSGPYCQGNCMEYPFSDLLAYYPRDYYWMYCAIFQLFVYIAFMTVRHSATPKSKKVFSSVSLSFTLISATVLLLAYFTQFSVIPISMQAGETDGIAILTQYNGHGLFIAMEELGYIAMSLSLCFLIPAHASGSKLEKAIRLILLVQLILTVILFIFYAIQYGIERSYRFEVATITINWLTLITIGILTAIMARKDLKKSASKETF
jgi:hypothetical protein